MILGQEFALSAALSAAAAGMSHVIHHPLYTLKSQMMYYGAEFSLKNFLHRAATERTSFLYRGEFFCVRVYTNSISILNVMQ